MMIGKLLLGLFGLYVAVGVGFRVLEHKFLFHPDADDFGPCSPVEGVEKIQFDGEQALLTQTGSEKLLVFYHGNGSDMCNWRYLGPNHLAPLGFDTLVVEFPGYLGDKRPVGKKTLLPAAERAHRWAAQRYKTVVVMGYSMGSAPAAHHTKQGGVDKLILFAPFDTMYALLRSKGYWFPRFMLRNDFDNVAALASDAPPSVVIHGARDDLIPPERGKALAAAIGARFILREDRGHSGLLGGPEFDVLLASELDGV